MTTNNEPLWLPVARSLVGVGEIPGKETSPVIRQWLISLGAWWTDDETPWCGVFVAHCLRMAGVTGLPKHYYRARAWLEWGTVLPVPAPGCLVVFGRQGGGHVGFVDAVDSAGRLLVVGGNQKNKVGIDPFERDRVLGYRYPANVPLPAGALLTLAHNAKVASSQNEA